MYMYMYMCKCVCLYICIYLIAFGTSTTVHGWGGLRLRGRSLGSRGMPLEGFLETVLMPLGSRFGASWGLFWISWGLLGPLGGSWGLPGASWGHLGADGSDFRFVFPLLGRLGVVLVASLAVLGRACQGCGHGLGGRVEASWEQFWGLLGSLLGLLGAAWVLGL